ncbi:secretion/DNA translocation related TadE-like protein [Microbacterium terrae]|uniref:Rv3654c family TadE-like protein n=1 Tax=Microbacterium terrae TaxID=69369 RepID=UPI001B3AECDA|nr:Rv3654c family TadE-like protein [Microbacterium terrae]MBP1076618.1 secretion/DNA translocation related TadE-like protein [Microbacterium terrae]GLJ97446.1 hypothetical protein GCM10017594_06430 [Microbacterium terrae]
MAGAVAAVGVIACAGAVGFALATAGAASVCSQRVAAAADAAALAAADTAAGAAVGVPCERAAELAEAGGARLVACDLDGLVATVEVAGDFGPFEVAARARAGPPPTGGP